MADGLSLNAIVSVEEQLQPQGATGRNFGNLLILGDSDVVDITERLRLYTDLDDIGTDYGTTAPEYLAAQVFLAALPTPPQLYLGRWASNPTSGRLLGGALATAQQVITLWTGITDGAFAITVDGAVQNPASLDCSQAANMNGVASVIQTAISGVATCVWNAAASRFEI